MLELHELRVEEVPGACVQGASADRGLALVRGQRSEVRALAGDLTQGQASDTRLPV